MIDTDPGTDDAVALWLALGSPELDVRLVSVVGGNVGLERTVINARAIVGLAGSGAPREINSDPVFPPRFPVPGSAASLRKSITGNGFTRRSTTDRRRSMKRHCQDWCGR